jgi:hypothetical protein
MNLFGATAAPNCYKVLKAVVVLHQFNRYSNISSVEIVASFKACEYFSVSISYEPSHVKILKNISARDSCISDASSHSLPRGLHRTKSPNFRV